MVYIYSSPSITIALFMSFAHTLLPFPFAPEGPSACNALPSPLPAMHFPPLSASVTPMYSPDLNSGMISLGESSPRPLVDQILHNKLSLHKSLYSNMLSYLKFYKALYDYKCDEELSSLLDCKFLRQAPCQCWLITRSSAPSTLPGMKEVHYDIFKRIVSE